MNKAITGLILAGGQSSRMGGACKALQLLHGRPLLAWVMDALAPQVEEMLISAGSGDAGRFRAYDARIVRDEFRQAGPLAGMHAGLKAARHELLATAPCDVPYLPRDMVARLAAAMEAGRADIAIARTAERRQPTCTLLRRSALPALAAYLASGGRKADGWYAGLCVAEVEFADARAFSNFNTLEELAAQNAAGR